MEGTEPRGELIEGAETPKSPKPGEPAVVLEHLPNEMLLVQAENGDRVAVHASGKMRVRIVRVLPGERIRIQRSPFDATKGRIVADE